MTKRRRKRRQARHSCDPPTATTVNWDRLHQLYGNLEFRRQPILQDLVPSGIVVEATTPDELVEKTDDLLIARTRNEPEN